MSDTLFDSLDLNGDNHLSRRELHAAARQLGWHWRQAPLLALLDLLTLEAPLNRDLFDRCRRQIADDSLGPYGRVLQNSPGFASSYAGKRHLSRVSFQPPRPAGATRPSDVGVVLARHAGVDVADHQRTAMATLPILKLPLDRCAVLIIDPQRAFTSGVWMRSIGDLAAIDTLPIVLAFENAALVLESIYGRTAVMFTRCPFPPDSYPWDRRIAAVIDEGQPYFIKPGNSVLFPPDNGFSRWVQHCLDHGRTHLVMCGCTTNSCVRVSAMETCRYFRKTPLKVVVDVSLCGARLRNFIPASAYGANSAVGSALDQMQAAGVAVCRRVEFRG